MEVALHSDRLKALFRAGGAEALHATWPRSIRDTHPPVLGELDPVLESVPGSDVRGRGRRPGRDAADDGLRLARRVVHGDGDHPRLVLVVDLGRRRCHEESGRALLLHQPGPQAALGLLDRLVPKAPLAEEGPHEIVCEVASDAGQLVEHQEAMASVPRSTAMEMVGHATESIYRRYAIADEAMLREGAAKLAKLHQSERDQAPTVVPISAARSRPN
jgi:hypothetical protein